MGVTELGRAIALDAIRRDWPAPGPRGQIVEVGFLFLIPVVESVAMGLGFSIGSYAANEYILPGDDELNARAYTADELSTFLYHVAKIELQKAETYPPLSGPRAAKWAFAITSAKAMPDEQSTTAFHLVQAIRQLQAAFGVLYGQELLVAAGKPAPQLGPGEPLKLVPPDKGGLSTVAIVGLTLGGAALLWFLAERS